MADSASLPLTGSKFMLESLSAGSTASRNAEVLAIIESAMNSTDYREGTRAFLEKRKPIFTGR